MAIFKKDAVATTPNETALAQVPEFLQQYVGKGLEHITKQDIIMPRLALAQGLSPQLSPDDPTYIDGLKLGDAFNTVSKQIYGRGPWDVVIIRADPPRWIEFFPRDAGGGVKDMNVPRNDPRTAFTTGPNGESVPPLATQFYDFVMVFLESREVIGVSFKSTGLKVARGLNTVLRFRMQERKIPLVMIKLTARAFMDKNSKGTFANLRFELNGDVTDIETLKFLQNAYEAIKDKELNLEREPGADDDIPAGM